MRPSVLPLAAAFLLATSLAGTAAAQPRAAANGAANGAANDSTRPRVLRVAGERAGPSVFPLTDYPEVRPLVPGQLDWKHYHSSAEIEEWMRKWAEQYPNLVSLYQVGEAFSGRPVWQVTLTNKKTGKDTDKPGAFFEGGRHSGEITATESAFYLLWHLLDQYGKDAAITRLLDTKAVYIRPLNNPDGSDMYRLTAQTNRSSVRPHDSDGDGLLDEDPGEDLDNDGYVREMRVKVGAGKGNFILDPEDRSGRLMKRVREGAGDWRVYSEGVDNDLDGRYNEDGVGGLDLHRNYPQNWRPEPGGDSTGRGYTQSGAGAYPLSEPETRSVVMFLLSHPNVGVVNTMDTSVPMHLRGPSTCDDSECVFPEDLALLQHFDSVGLAITKYPWAGNVYRTYATRFPVNAFTGDSSRPEPLFGHSPDFGYFGYGAVWYGDELWNGGRERDYDGDGQVEAWEVLKYCDDEFGGTCFKKWTPYQHPQLGKVEIGGYNPKFFAQNGPPQVMEKWARNQALFNLYMAQSLPLVEIVSATVTALPGAAADSATHEVRVTVRNSGFLPTALEQAKRVKIVRPDRVTAQPAKGSATRMIGQPPEFWLGGGETQTVTLRLKAGSAAADRKVTVRALSTRGGMAERELTW
ncbi:MAG TPA: M14 family metallopeptidase [Gemmatimonadaceae bacterium]|nr:M14 family metallopeptidase [Gemmatimonadaceae bacterium]